MKKILLTVIVLILYSCSNPASPEPAPQISAKLNGMPLELYGWSSSEEKQLEIFVYDSTENVRAIIDDNSIGLHKAFLQYQTGCMVYTASRADILITSIDDGLLSCGISFYVMAGDQEIEGTVKIDSMKVR